MQIVDCSQRLAINGNPRSRNSEMSKFKSMSHCALICYIMKFPRGLAENGNPRILDSRSLVVDD
jgi:hypothetical protein